MITELVQDAPEQVAKPVVSKQEQKQRLQEEHKDLKANFLAARPTAAATTTKTKDKPPYADYVLSDDDDEEEMELPQVNEKKEETKE